MKLELHEGTICACIGNTHVVKTALAQLEKDGDILPTEIIDVAALTAAITDNASTVHDAKHDVTALVEQLVTARAKHNRTTFIHIPSAQLSAYVNIAKQQHVPIVAITFDESLSNTSLPVYTYDGSVTIERVRSRFVLPLQHGLDIIGDIHGCYDDMIALLKKLGYVEHEGLYTHPEQRKLLSIGDVMSRGPQSVQTLQFWLTHIRAGVAYMTDSNHGYKIGRWLAGNAVSLAHGDELVEQEFTTEQDALKAELAQLLLDAPSHYIITENEKRIAVATHAGIKDHYIGKDSKRIRAFCRFGDVDGFSEDGKPIRKPWYNERKDTVPIIWGHVPHIEPTRINNTINIDQGAVFGGQLTAYRLPEETFHSVYAQRNYVPTSDNPITELQQQRFKHVKTLPYDDGFTVPTKSGDVTIRASLAKKAALLQQADAMPPLPTMSTPPPLATSEDYFIHPSDVFAYYKKRNVRKLVMQQHMNGERALLFIARDERSAELFSQRSALGSITDERGEPFLQPNVESELVMHIHSLLADYFEQHSTKYVLFEAIISPFNAHQNSDIYAHQENASNELAARHAELALAPTSYKALFVERLRRAVNFEAALHNYSWPVTITTLRMTPLRLLAHSTEPFTTANMSTHIQFAKTLAQYGTLFTEAPYRIIETEADEAHAIAWWEELSQLGHVGAFISPMEQPKKRMVSTFVVYGREYLRLLYGIDYTADIASLHEQFKKGALRAAMTEQALYDEWVERFVSFEPAETLYAYTLALRALQLQEDIR